MCPGCLGGFWAVGGAALDLGSDLGYPRGPTQREPTARPSGPRGGQCPLAPRRVALTG